MEEFIKGFGFSGYRSYGQEITRIYPLRKINFFIGKNNSGKSNIINYLHKHYNHTVINLQRVRSKEQEEGDFTLFDDFQLTTTSFQRQLSFMVPYSIEEYVEILVKNSNKNRDNPAIDREFSSILRKLLKSKHICSQDNTIWFTYNISNSKDKFSCIYNPQEIKEILQFQEWNRLFSLFTNTSGGGIDQYWIPEVMRKISYYPKKNELKEIYIIPAVRKIDAEIPEDDKNLSGRGIIQKLAQLQHPKIESIQQRERFEQIQNFLRSVIDEPKALIEVPHTQDDIYVNLNGLILPLSSLGTGVHEVIILAVAATIVSHSIVCIEEPELHLHPRLQRKLINYLQDETTNQYFITTHSAHFLDCPNASIFHVTHDGKESRLRCINHDAQKVAICEDLGYKPSDILQANCIIWVEGPSDRIYINRWIKEVNPLLMENIDYVIMFYGGRLLSHLTVKRQDELTDEILKLTLLRSLNQKVIIVIDSDKNSPKDRVNKTKARIRREFEQDSGFAWITSGREIENYIDKDTLMKCISFVHPGTILNNINQFSKLSDLKKDGKKVSPDKISIARHYAEQTTVNLDVLDLKKMINKLCRYIEESSK